MQHPDYEDAAMLRAAHSLAHLKAYKISTSLPLKKCSPKGSLPLNCIRMSSMEVRVGTFSISCGKVWRMRCVGENAADIYVLGEILEGTSQIH